MSIVRFETNAAEFNLFLKEVFEVTDDLRVPWGLISIDFYKSERQIFSLKSPGGYPDLAASTKASKLRDIGRLYPILFRTGVLASSVLSPTAQGSIHIVRKKSLTIGTSVPYARFQQEGTNRIPARPFLYIDGGGQSFPGSPIKFGRIERWTGIMSNYIQKVYQQRGWTR